jgi:prepilin-type N-terminal cleavage/methylation domain-containing protein
MLNSRKGFTLIEMIIVMAVFIVVIMISGDAFKMILTQMTKITKSEENNIEGVVGLEMFRHDLQQAGYGLPYSYQAPISYLEAGYAPANAYNDGTGSTASWVPRAVVAGYKITAASGVSDGTDTYNILANTDYLALKGSTLGPNNTAAQKWTYVPYSSGITGKKKPRIWSSANLAQNDRVIVVKKTFATNTYNNQLVYNTADPTIYWANFDVTGFADAAFLPALATDIYYVYGIKSATSTGTYIGMPFNRTDYFIGTPSATTKLPAFCAPNTGILYKGTLSHSVTTPGGRMTFVPLVDCVADMKVVFGWDLDDGQGNEGQDGVVDTYSTPCKTPLGPANTNCSAITVTPSANQTRVTNAMSDPAKLRNGLKVIKVYILAQVGSKDTNYQSSNATFTLGDQTTDGISSTYTLASNMMNYRWKIYRIVVRPPNLITSQ